MSCVSTPTATQFATVTSSSVSTSFSAQATTLAGQTSTGVVTSCLDSLSLSSGSGGLCASSTVITSTSVIPGSVSTTQVPFEVTAFFTSIEATNTLFAPCTTSNGDTTTTTSTSTSSKSTTSTTPSSTPPTSSPPSSTTQFSTSLTTALTTPTTTFTSAFNTTLPDGSVTETLQVVTSTLAATSVVLTSFVPQATIQSNANGGSGSTSSNLAPIIGGSVGGFFGLLALVGGIWFWCRRRPNWDDILEKDYDEYSGANPITHVRRDRSRMLDMEDAPVHPNPPEANTEPKPYVYGLVGAANMLSPPSLNAGVTPTPVARSLGGHNRSPSEVPLMNSNTPSASSSRPNSFTASAKDGAAAGSVAGLSPSPSPSAAASTAGGRDGSLGPLGVAINTGPSLSMPSPTDPDSPMSLAAPRGTLFVTNQPDPSSSPPTSPVSSGSPGSPGSNRSQGAGAASFAGAMAGAPGPPTSFSRTEMEKQRLQHQDSVSSRSVYSQASATPSQQTARGQRRLSTGVVVHTDGGRVLGPDQPPSYSG